MNKRILIACEYSGTEIKCSAKMFGMKTKLSVRQRQLVFLIVQGMTAKGAAGMLGISVRTAESHLVLARRKYKAVSLVHLVYLLRKEL